MKKKVCLDNLLNFHVDDHLFCLSVSRIIISPNRLL